MLDLLHLDEMGDGCEVVILRREPTDDKYFYSYVSVDDEALLDCLYSIFKERFSDESVFVG